MKSMPAELQALAAAQHEVLTRAQLNSMDVDRHHVSRRDPQSWRALGPRVVVLHRGGLSKQQMWWVAVLHASLDSGSGPAGAALTGLSAAEAGGLLGFEATEVHVAVQHGRETADLVHPLVTVRVHQTRHLHNAEVHPVLEPRRIRLPRAVVESASGVAIDRPQRARALIAAAVQQRLVRPDDLRTFAAGRRTLPGRRLLLETIADAAGGAHSLPELEFQRGLRRAGLPVPTRQRRLQHADGTWYLDNDFEDFLVTVEVNGLQHYEQLLKEADDLRRAVLQISGRIVVDLSSYAVRHQIEQCMIVVAATLETHGYQPPAETRSRLDTYLDQLGWDRDALRVS